MDGSILLVKMQELNKQQKALHILFACIAIHQVKLIRYILHGKLNKL